MDILGIGLQELSVALVTAIVITIHIRMLLDLWRNPGGMVYRLVWTVIIVAMPLVGPFLYWWFVKVKF
jgi:hypothetical protein